MATKFQKWGTQYGGSTLGALGDIFTGIGGKIKESKERKQKEARQAALDRAIEKDYPELIGASPELQEKVLIQSYKPKPQQRSYAPGIPEYIRKASEIKDKLTELNKAPLYMKLGNPDYDEQEEALNKEWHRLMKITYKPGMKVLTPLE